MAIKQRQAYVAMGIAIAQAPDLGLTAEERFDFFWEGYSNMRRSMNQPVPDKEAVRDGFMEGINMTPAQANAWLRRN